MISLAHSTDAIARPRAVPKRSSKLGAETLTPEERKRRVVEAACKAGAREGEAAFDAVLNRIAKAKQERT